MNAIYFYNGYFFLFYKRIFNSCFFCIGFLFHVILLCTRFTKVFNLDILLNSYAYSCLRETSYRYRCTN